MNPFNRDRQDERRYPWLLTDVWPALTVLVSVEVSELLRSHAGALRLPLPAGGTRGAQGLPLDAEQRLSGPDHVAAGRTGGVLLSKYKPTQIPPNL